MSGGQLWDKSVAILRVANRGAFADASLREVLTALMARLSAPASMQVSLGTSKVDVESLVANIEISAALRGCVAALANEIRAR